MSYRFMYKDFTASRSPSLEDAKHIAMYWHARQDDGTGRLYIAHLERVVDNLHRLHHAGLIALPSVENQMIAWLHDTPEDTEMPNDYLARLGFSSYVTCGVDILHRRKAQSYENYIRNIIESGHKGAMTCKLADNIENCHPQKRAILRQYDPERADKLDRKYRMSIPMLCRGLRMGEAKVWALIERSPQDQPIGASIIPRQANDRLTL